MGNTRYAVMSVVLAIVLVVAALFSISGPQQALASVPGPLLAPTPVSVNLGGIGKALTFYSTKVLTADTASGNQGIIDANKVDLQWVVDQTAVAGVVNTTTLKLQFSNDGVNWIDGATVLNANTADANDMQQYLLFGRYARIYADVSNTNPLTLTVLGVGK